MLAARLAAALLLALTLSLLGADKAALCQVEGQVSHSAAGTPLKKVILRLKRFEAGAGVTNEPGVATYTTTSDAAGKFVFDDVDPGSYWLTAERTGFLEQSYGTPAPLVRGTPLKLAAAQHANNLVVKMTPQSLLYGKVSDEDGDPLPNAQITVLKAAYAHGRRTLQQVNQETSSADGSFVIGELPPGRYYLTASNLRQEEGMGPNSSKPAREAYALTYYPGVADPAGAAPVDVTAGAEVRGLEIRLRKQRVFQIHVKAVDTATGKPAGHVSVQMNPVDDGGSFAENKNIGAVPGKDGIFEFQGVAPGTYAIESSGGIGMNFMSVDVRSGEVGQVIARTFHLNGPAEATLMPVEGPPKPDAMPLIGRVVVHVADRDLDDVILRLGPGADLTGAVQTESAQNPDQRAPVPGQPMLILTPHTAGDRSPVTMQAKPDGTFEFHGLAPDVYTVEVGGIPEGSYLKSVRLSGRDIPANALDLNSGAGGAMEILLSPAAGSVSGRVRTADGDPAAGALVQVWSAPDGRVLAGETDANGSFRVDALAPGDYKVLAYEETDPTLTADPAFRIHFEGKAAAVKLGAHSKESVDVKLVTRDVIEAEAAKMR